MEHKKLNLGSGSFSLEGYINIDRDPLAEPQVVHDLNDIPYPFEPGSFDEVRMDHSLEHLDDAFGVVAEIVRITKKGGTIVIRVPHFSRGFTHPEHRRGFDVTFNHYFDPAFKGGYCGTHLLTKSVRLRWMAQPQLKKIMLPAPLFIVLTLAGGVFDFFANLCLVACSRGWCFLVGGFEEIEFIFTRPD